MTASPAKSANPAPVEFIDLGAQQRRIGDKVEAAVKRVLAHGKYIMGPEVKTLEEQLARFAGVKHVVSCASGTDALSLPLMALGVGPGDAVFVPTFTFAATAEVVALVGATPIFVDVEAGSFNMDVKSLQRAVDSVPKGLTPKGIIPVDLFGQPADYTAIDAVAKAKNLWVLADAAQSFGATQGNKRTGSMGRIAGTSFFPAKPLGCYGDGGAIFTDDDGLNDIMKSLRVHGQGNDKYDNVRIGMNGRLDTIQAAILLEKLAIFEDEIAARQRVGKRYNDLLRGTVTVPEVGDNFTSVWAQYTLRLPNRDKVAAALKADSIPTAIYYPRPLHQQTAYRDFPVAPGGCPTSEKLAGEVLSLPMHPYLDTTTQDRIVAAVKSAVG
jgi:dTDP-4-amino-4,6-dideoxygalactose transaminase